MFASQRFGLDSFETRSIYRGNVWDVLCRHFNRCSIGIGRISLRIGVAVFGGLDSARATAMHVHAPLRTACNVNRDAQLLDYRMERLRDMGEIGILESGKCACSRSMTSTDWR